MAGFIHLHSHTEYSILDGVAKIDAYIEKVKAHGMNAAAITDHGVMYGNYEFWQKCKYADIKPILGCEVYVAERSRHDKTPGIDNKRYHLTLLAKNKEGYHNLLKIVSYAQTEGYYYKPRADRELLEKYGKGLIALSGCLGSNFNQYLMAGERDKAVKWVKFLQRCVDDVYIELQRNGVQESHDLIPTQIEIAKELGLDYVATCDTHYIEQEDHKVQEIVWCISDGKKIDDPTRRQYASQEFYIKSTQEMEELFHDLPEAVANTQKIADSVEVYGVEFERIQPKYEVDWSYDQTKEQLRQNVYDLAGNRYPELTDEIKQRIDYELSIIDQKGYNDYFLVVQDYINWARENDILVGPGRGSGGGSVVAYILGIINIDPFKYDLIFERFLNPERPSPPDFDIDFQDDRRDELFEYMSRRYGRENTSFIGTFGRLKTKAAIRDVARVMGIDLSLADQLSKMVIVKFGRVHSMEKMRAEVPEFDQIISGSNQLEELAGYVTKLENLARHVSIHACGYLVTPTPITDYVPVQKESKGGDKQVTQVEGHNLEYMGLMKFDFLGLSNLTVIKNTLKQIKANRGEVVDIDKINMEDKKTFELFQHGDTTGVFQFESDGMKKYLRDLQPSEFEDLIFLNAAYRPGPMQYIPDYILRKKGEQQVTYLHPSLEPILKNTYGFAIYQEQVIRIAVEFANYSLGEADILRRAMGKKKPEVMAKEKEVFITKATGNGHSKDLAESVFTYLEPFADYGFNRSHSACYSMIAYQTAYLKANYPLEFLAGLMETDLNSQDKLERDLQEAKEMHIKILPPDINESEVMFSIKGKDIRFGLGGIKGSSSKSLHNIVNERKKSGKFKHLDQLISEVGTSHLTKKDLEYLVKVGAMKEFGHQSQLLEIIPLVYEKIQNREKSLQGGQVTLFGGNDNQVAMTPLPHTAKVESMQELLWEKEILGTYISQHPLDRYKTKVYINNFTSLEQARKLSNKTKFSTIGMFTRIKKIYTKKDAKAMAFVEVEDIEGKAEGVIFPGTYEKLADQITENTPLFITAISNFRNDEFSLMIEDLAPADMIQTKDSITIDISKETNKEKITQLKDLIQSNPGSTKLSILYGDPNNKKKVEKEITPTEEVILFLKNYQTKKN